MEASLHRLRNASLYPGPGCEPVKGSDDDVYLSSQPPHSIPRISQINANQDLLHRTVQEACQFSYGTRMVEVWVWDSVLSKLFRPDGGWWIDPYWHSECHATDGSCTFCQFVDKSRNDYIAPPTLSPGVGIPGVLWSDLGHKNRKHKRRDSTNSRRDSTSRRGSSSGNGFDKGFLLQVFGNISASEARLDQMESPNERIAWRDVKALAEDPDQPRTHRLQVVASTDLRWTGGVTFQIKGEQGVVVYYARDKVNLEKLQDKTNTDYLIQAADFIGSAWALRLPRQAAVNRRQEETSHNFRRVKYALLFLIREGVTLNDLSKTAMNPRKRQSTVLNRLSGIFYPPQGSERWDQVIWKKVKKKVRQSLVKLKGGGTIAPPSSSWNQATLTTMGVLLTILALGTLNEGASATFGSDYRMPLGPMGALLGLQFGLTAAPAAQPRTIIVGQVVSILIALAFAEISSVDAWIKQSLACAVAVGCMAKIGVVNPPAAANAFIFASGSWGFAGMVVTLLGNVVAILCSVLLNNVSDKRQYPSFWGIPPILQCSPSKVSKNHQPDPIEALFRRNRARRAKKSAKTHETNDKGGSDPITGIEPNIVEDVELGAGKKQNDSGRSVAVTEHSTDNDEEAALQNIKSSLRLPSSLNLGDNPNDNETTAVVSPSVRFQSSGSDREDSLGALPTIFREGARHPQGQHRRTQHNVFT